MELISLNNKLTPVRKITELFQNFFSFNKRKTYFLLIDIQEYSVYERYLSNGNIYTDELMRTIVEEYPNFDRGYMTHLFNEKATKRNIYQALISCERKINKEDNLLVYFSGLSAVASERRYFVPYGANDIDEYILHEDLFSSIQTIAAANIFITCDWQDLNDVKKLSKAKLDMGLDSDYYNRKQYWKNQFELLQGDKFSLLFANFIASTPKDYNRDTFLFLKGAEQLLIDSALDAQQGKFLEEDKFNSLDNLLAEKKFSWVIESLQLTLEPDSEFYIDLLRIKLSYLRLNESIRHAVYDKAEIEKQEKAIGSSLYEMLQTIKDLGITVVFLPSANNQTLMKKKTILISSANPQDSTWLRLDKEMRKIDEEVNKAGYRDNFEIIKLTATRINDLQDALLRYSPNYVHFSGHGCSDGICLVDDKDLTNVILNEPLAKLFSLFSAEIECVFLNSCYSKEQSEVIRKSIPKVIGMKDTVDDDTAIEFAAAFYKAIASNKTVDFSFQFAINSIDLNKLDGSDVPILLS